MDNTSPLGPSERLSHGGSQLNGSGLRRPTTLMTPNDRKLISPPQNLVLTIHKDAGGYGMKVSGDNPVYVESVKAGGASQKAGLHEGDMILKVNGTNVRYSTHTNVVQLIKSTATVELTVQRNYKMQQRPSSISVGPSTPLAQRGGITGPKPVDSATSHDVKMTKIQTLHLYLDKEKKNLETLKSTNANRQDILRAEHTIRTLQEQLQLLCVEGSTMHNLFTPIQSPPTNLHPQPAPPSTPAFLSRFPRSLSSLSLGGKKKPADKENTVTTTTTTTPVTSIPHQQSATSPYSSGGEMISPTNYPASSPTKKSKISASHRDLKNADVPPPLPERNIPRPKQSSTDSMDGDVVLRRNVQISDLDHSVIGLQSPNNAANNNSQSSPLSNKSSASSSSAGKGKQRSKQKMKALSDPKMSSQMFIQMEQAQGNHNQQHHHHHHHHHQSQKQMNDDAPPLPPRLPGMLEEKQNLLNNNKFGKNNFTGRPPPNSLETHLSYPLIATCTAVREDLSAFPLSHRPNIVQQLQQSTHHHSSATTTTSTIAATSVSKSAALGLTQQQMSKLNSSQHRRVVSSPEHYHQREPSDPIDDRRQTTSGSWDIPERDNETTPADGTPPPRYSPTPNQLDDSMTDSLFESSYPDLNRPSNVLHQRQIISMEDDEMTEEQDSINEDHGPFRSLHQLLEQENLAYLSVFLNFVLSNSNPSPLLFYLITGLYKDGTIKDMRKWAYEIHSTFLVPRAPLLWCGVDESESLARDVDNVLQNEHHKSEILRSIFRKSRQRAKEHINQQIDEFKVKRIAGLGTLYGPSDHQLMEAKGDKVKEQKVFEETLVPKLQQLVDELEKESPNECPKKSALSSALSTVLHRIFVTRSNPGGPIDRVHHFVSREKSFKSRLMGKNRKAMVRGHHLVLRQYYEVAHCNHCQNIIWGVSPQGYHCTDCELNIHRACSKVLEENCPGPAPSKQKGQHTENKMTKLIDKIRPTHYFNDRPRRQDEDGANEDLATCDRPTSTSVVRQPSDRRPDISNSSTAQNSVDLTHAHSVDTDSNAPDAEPANRDSSKSKSAPVSVNRSESYKERLSHRRNRNNRRKTSDPSLSKTNDEQQVDLGISNANFASSSSSLSSNPSTSLEAVAPTAGQGTIPAPRQWVDSDDEAGDCIADWSSNVAADILQTLSDAEKKRQEIINEIYQTERNHVRTLRLLEGIFMRPLQESNALNAEHLNLLFPPALLILKDHHSSFEQQLKQRRIEHGSLVGDIGDLLLTMFDGRTGEELKENAAHFCARQQIALEALKEKRRKDEHLQRLLTKAESHKACRRLQLKDLLPTALQRLTKYPLLFESLYKITVRVSPDNDAEAIAIRKALDNSKRILDHVNQAVRHAEDAHKLQTIQKKLDKTNYEKEASSEFKNVDLTQHKLLHDGPPIMKKNPSVQLHGLLFENMMVLLQKQDDKYILKFHNNPGAGAAEGKSIEGRFNPISKINLILVRRSAVDTNAFFLINTSVTQMLELTAPSSSECKTWFKHISDAAEAYKSRTKGNHDISEDPIPATLSNSPTKESLEGTPEKELSSTATQNDQSNVSNNNVDGQKNISNDANEQNNNSDVKDVNDEKQIGRDTVEDDEEEVNVRHRKYSSGTRILTQQSSLIDPSEVQISVSPVLTAEPVLTPQEQLRRLDEAIRFKLAEKQKVICDMYRVPNEHFSEIADIAGQPEAPKEPSDIVLAAFAQVQSLTETLNEHMKVSCRQEILAIATRVCDDCHSSCQHQTRHSHKNSLSQATTMVATATTTTTSTTTSVETQQTPTLPANVRNGAATIDPVPDDDGYCEIDELRLPTTINNVPQQTQSSTSTNNTTTTTTTTTPELKRQSTISADSIPEETEHEINAELLASSVLCDSELGDVIEVNDAYDGTECGDDGSSTVVDSISDHLRMQLLNTCMESMSGGGGLNQMNPVNSLAPAVPCHLLTQFVATLNLQLSLLLPKLNERDIEREKLRKENQHLRELLNSMHERERVSSERETPERASDARKSSKNK